MDMTGTDPEKLVRRIGRENFTRGAAADAEEELLRLPPEVVALLVEAELEQLDALIDRSRRGLAEWPDSRVAHEQFEGQITVFDTGRQLLANLLLKPN